MTKKADELPVTCSEETTHEITSDERGTDEPTTATVFGAALRVREEPFIEGKPTGDIIRPGEVVTVLDHANAGEWAQIAEPAGWVPSEYLRWG